MAHEGVAESIRELLAAPNELDLGALVQALTPFGDDGGPRPWMPVLLPLSSALVSPLHDVVRRVAPLLASPSLSTRHRAAQVLARIPTEAAALAAVPALSDRLGFIVAEGIDAVARGGGSESADVLVELLNHPDETVRLRAAGDLGLMRNPAAVAALVSTAEDADEDEYVRAWAATSLGELGTPEALAALHRIAPTASPVVADGIRAGISARVPVTSADLALTQHPERRVHAAAHLLGTEAIALLVLLELYGDPDVGLAARGALMATSVDLEEPLLEVLAGNSERLAAAVDLAGLLGLVSAVPQLESLMTERGEPGLALLAGIALVRLGAPTALERLAIRWARYSADQRTEGTLGGMFANDVVPLDVVQLLLGDPCAVVSASGAELLRREPDGERASQLLAAALQTELLRVQGREPPRPTSEAGPIGTVEFRAEYGIQCEVFRASLPEELQAGAAELDMHVYVSPETIAARALLWVCLDVDGDFDAVLEPWMKVADPQLRLDALRVWAGLHPDGLPAVDLSTDPEPVIRRFYAILQED